MASFTFNLPNGQPFEIKGPAGLTFEQAKSIFDKQAATGSLVGFKPGDVLSSATQATSGLAAAQAQLSQTISGVTGALGGGISSAVAQVGSVAQNITGTASQIGSAASSAISTITKTLTSTPVTNGINVADFAKQVPALAPIASLSSSQVTGVLAQAKNLVGQASDVLSNTKGVGSFGLDANQLTAAGFLKPGIADKLLSGGTNTLTSVLKSPTVFTGKDGVNNIQSLLKNVNLQNKTQQGLMSAGASGLKELGLPVDNLSPAAIAGPLLSAAKSLPNTEKLLKGVPVPSDIKAGFDTVVKDGAFAVAFTDSNVPNAFKAVSIPVPAVDTVNRDTLNAAATRIVGNSKIPAVNYGPPRPADPAAESQSITTLVNDVTTLITDTTQKFDAIESKVDALESKTVISADEWSALDYEMSRLRKSYNNKIDTVVAPANAVFTNASPAVKKEFDAVFAELDRLLIALRDRSRSLRARIAALAEKIGTPT